MFDQSELEFLTPSTRPFLVGPGVALEGLSHILLKNNKKGRQGGK
jgi:hypothetical protein